MGKIMVIIIVGLMATGMVLGPFITQTSRDLKEIKKRISNKLHK